MSVKELEEALKNLQAEKEELEEELRYLREKEAVPWPREFSVYIHNGDISEDSAYVEFVKESGWIDGGDEARELERCSYEHLMTYSVDKSGNSKLISVDGIMLEPEHTDSEPPSAVKP